ncbi:MAG: hypothetical protein COV75_06210 [Candidatus Omnitrophica bacterium CG11_big_fil_rev_8_21_14_0_20_63_9]|nr:MAG: hypothetical protein COV75_06210 [Candidatus Omnitrophica bacterium CG11_big_fil_rev_8_21_14_0_20_63_9]
MSAPRPLPPHAYRWLSFTVLALVLFGPGLYDWVRLSLWERRLDRQLSRLSAEHEQLTQEHVRLQTDPTYVEGLIRSTFKVAQPGEIVIPLESSRSVDNSR